MVASGDNDDGRETSRGSRGIVLMALLDDGLDGALLGVCCTFRVAQSRRLGYG